MSTNHPLRRVASRSGNYSSIISARMSRHNNNMKKSKSPRQAGGGGSSERDLDPAIVSDRSSTQQAPQSSFHNPGVSSHMNLGQSTVTRDKNQPPSRERPPPHLKGKDIGLWYARRSGGDHRDRQNTARESPSRGGGGRGQNKMKPSKMDMFINADKYRKMKISLSLDRQSKIIGLLAKLNSLKVIEPSINDVRTDANGDVARTGAISRFQENYIENILENRRAPSLSLNSLALSSSTSKQPSASSSSSSTIPKGLLFSAKELDTTAELTSSITRRPDNPITLEAFRNQDLDQFLYEEMKKKTASPAYEGTEELRSLLPTYACKDELLHLILKHQVVVIEGETGCGKTTQIPQYILDAWIEAQNGSICNIVCTQPRRISAISVAERVGFERGETIGASSSIGYSIRLESKLPSGLGGTLTFVTTGILLQRLISDPYLNKTSHLIIDEVHERDVESDFILAIIKDLCVLRPDLKVILMSATINADSFVSYFGTVPSYHIHGFTYPVKELYLEDILEATEFKYEPELKLSNSQSLRFGSKGQSETQRRIFEVFIRPYIRELEKSCEYSKSTLTQLCAPESESNNINFDLIQTLIEYICQNDPGNGSILVFVPGWSEISKLHDRLTGGGETLKNATPDAAAKIKANADTYLVIPLHSQLPTINQKEVFSKPPLGKRKIVIATNIAETSITIDDIVHVIDSGKTKMTNFNTDNNIESLDTEWVSRANSKQRRGRAGRTQPGYCYHLFNKHRESKFEDFKSPEVLRKSLVEEILRLKLLKLGDIKEFFNKFLDPPSPKAIQLGIKRLQRLQALDDDENLTPLGFHLAQLPMNPQIGRMILMGAIFSCLDPILSIAASLSHKDPFYMPIGKDKIVDKIRVKFSDGTKSDHIAIINAFRGYEEAKRLYNTKSFCYDNFLSSSTLNFLGNLKTQYATHLMNAGFLLSNNYKEPGHNLNSNNIALLKGIICSGLYPNVAKVKTNSRGPARSFSSAVTEEDGNVQFHPKSINSTTLNFESPFVMYHTKVKSSSIFLHETSMISPAQLLFFGGSLDFIHRGGYGSIGVDATIRFICTKPISDLIERLRKELDILLEYKIQHPGPTSWNSLTDEGALLQTITELITTEYEKLMEVEAKGGFSDDDDYLLPDPNL